ncbi:putative ATP-grasp-modified RiPP [Streptomyces sp. NPDC006798]|uniref:putative ATP-grasp-modified RiPP n=1 Tax=Streptomyces sp. NPDC006798 TaxID=3155462 RepID=UPI0033F30069
MTLAPPAFALADVPLLEPEAAPAAAPVRPFGLALAVPFPAPAEELAGPLSFCPDRQVTVTDDGQPFIHAPSMKTAFKSQSQTREDMQLATDTSNDTD